MLIDFENALKDKKAVDCENPVLPSEVRRKGDLFQKKHDYWMLAKIFDKISNAKHICEQLCNIGNYDETETMITTISKLKSLSLTSFKSTSSLHVFFETAITL